MFYNFKFTRGKRAFVAWPSEVSLIAAIHNWRKEGIKLSCFGKSRSVMGITFFLINNVQVMVSLNSWGDGRTCCYVMLKSMSPSLCLINSIALLELIFRRKSGDLAKWKKFVSYCYIHLDLKWLHIKRDRSQVRDCNMWLVVKHFFLNASQLRLYLQYSRGRTSKWRKYGSQKVWLHPFIWLEFYAEFNYTL